MDPIQPRIFLINTTNNEKNLTPKVCSKKNFQKHLQGFVADFGRFAHIYIYHHHAWYTHCYIAVTQIALDESDMPPRRCCACSSWISMNGQLRGLHLQTRFLRRYSDVAHAPFVRAALLTSCALFDVGRKNRRVMYKVCVYVFLYHTSLD